MHTYVCLGQAIRSLIDVGSWENVGKKEN